MAGKHRRWYNLNNISGANSTTLTITGTTAGMNNNRYRCALSNATCPISVYSAAAILTVRQLPSVGLTAAPLTSLLPGKRQHLLLHLVHLRVVL